MAEDADSGEEVWSTPEEAAVGSFSPAADARVVEVKRRRDGQAAEVHIKVGLDYDLWVEAVRTDAGWIEVGDHN